MSPLREYTCSKCGLTLEYIEAMNGSREAKPCDCGGELEYHLSPSNFKFKGNKWYVNGYDKPIFDGDEVNKQAPNLSNKRAKLV